MYLALGEARAGQMIAALLPLLGQDLGALRAAADRGDRAGLARHARRVARLAGAVGLTGVSLAAGGVAGAAEMADDTAICATVQRLDRVAARSLALVRHLDEGAG